MFTQVEGLVVGEDVSLADLKGTLIAFARELFGAERAASASARASSRTPSRAPSSTSAARRAAAPAVRMCKQHRLDRECSAAAWCIPAVFEAVGYDPERYTGFAFGMGIERVALLKWGVEDIRLFYENDLRFLEQFPL